MEEWREIPGWEGLYEISTKGRVRTIERMQVWKDGRKRVVKSKLKTFGDHEFGYKTVHLQSRPKGVEVNKTVHSLMALTFLGPRGEGMVIRHIDGNPANNDIENITYGTQYENSLDRHVHKTIYNIKLTEEMVINAIKRTKNGESRSAIATSMGVDRGTISSILNGRSWKHVVKKMKDESCE